MIGFYHVCEYLAEASTYCAANDDDWMDIQKQRLRNNQYTLVIESLKFYLESDDVENAKAPVRACHRYLSNRTDQLDYKGAIEKNLPIGVRRNRKRPPVRYSEAFKIIGSMVETRKC